MIIIYIKIYFETIERIDLILNRKYNKIPAIIKKILCMVICTFNILTYKQIGDKIIFILPCKYKNISDRKIEIMSHKINKFISKINKLNEAIFLLAFASNIECKEKIKNSVKKYEQKNIICLDGRWLFSYLIFFTIKYISDQQQIKLQDQRVDILINELSDLAYYELWEFAENVKVLKLVTPKIYMFKKLEEKLYEKDGIAIEFSNNTKKSLSKSHIIVNMDFSSKEFNKYKINKSAIIIHMNKKTKNESISFCGINIYDCNISFNEKLKKQVEELGIYSDFDSNILYESYLYKKDKPEKIINQIINDKVEIKYLIGSKGKINDFEFKKMD